MSLVYDANFVYQLIFYFIFIYIYMALGVKRFKQATKKLGKKIDKNVHRLGEKTSSGLDQIDSGISKAGNVIHQADNIIKQVDKGLAIADKVAEVTGLSNTPVGRVIDLAHSGSAAAKKGLDKADRLHSKAQDASAKARKTSDDLEKFNSRKMIKKLAQENREQIADFVGAETG
jgi:methyl-accepting chemotaxis protein